MIWQKTKPPKPKLSVLLFLPENLRRLPVKCLQMGGVGCAVLSAQSQIPLPCEQVTLHININLIMLNLTGFITLP